MSFMTMIVLLKVSAIPMKVEDTLSNPRKIDTKNPRKKVRAICPRLITSEGVPISFITFGFRCKPTMKSKKAIPNLEKISITSLEAPALMMNGLIIIPATMYPMTRG